MKKTLFLLVILLLPVYSWATYKIYLTNGSVISGVSSYEETGDEVTVYFGTGSMAIPKKDVLRIEEKESPQPGPASEVPEEATGAQREQRQEAPPETTPPPASPAPADNKSERINTLKAELSSVNEDIKASEDQESKLTATINDKVGSRSHYNLIQIKQLEKELEPLRQELGAVQQKKAELIKRRSDIEAELKSLE